MPLEPPVEISSVLVLLVYFIQLFNHVFTYMSPESPLDYPGRALFGSESDFGLAKA